MFRRIVTRIIEWLRQLKKPAADPRKSSAYTYDRQQALLEKLQQAIGETRTAREHQEARVEALRIAMARHEKQANQALVTGNENLARQALGHRVDDEVELASLEKNLQELSQSEQRLVGLEARLITQIESIFARQSTIAERYSAAEKQAVISREMREISRDLLELESEFERAEARTDRMAARAEWLEVQG